MMGDHLGAASTQLMSQHGNEAMHLAVKFEFDGNLTADCLECTSEVVDGKTSGARDQPVRNFGRDLPTDHVVLPVFSPAVDQIVSLFQLVQHHWDVARVVLQIAVDGDDEVAGRVLNARKHRRGLSIVAAKQHKFYSPVLLSKLFKLVGRPIPAPVIDQNKVEGARLRFHCHN